MLKFEINVFDKAKIVLFQTHEILKHLDIKTKFIYICPNRD